MSYPQVCIIGSGPGGAFAAVELAKAGLSVLVIEAGTEVPDSDQGKTIDRLEVIGGAKPNFGFSRQIGGSSNLWAGRVTPLEKIDLDRRQWVGCSGWPISWTELDIYYRQALGIMGLGDSMPALSGALPEGWDAKLSGLELKQFQWSSPPFRAGDYLKSALERFPSNLRLLKGACVTTLEIGGNGRSVVAAHAVADGKPERVEADYFILAAGGIETPRILLNSTQYFDKGIGNSNEVVGRFLSTHPKADIGLLLLKQSTRVSYSAFSDQKQGSAQVRTGIGLSADTQARLSTLNHCVQLSPLFEHQANRAFELMKGGVAVGSPLLNRSAAIQGILPGMGAIAYEIIGRIAGLQRRAKKFVLRGFLDQAPHAENRVSLSNSTDRYGMRKVNVAWTFTVSDKNSVLSFLDELDRSFSEAGLGRVDYSLLRELEAWPIIGIHSHFMGTTRMGDDPKTSVVDANCRIHGLDNCYISGPSTFPSYGYANPFLTIAALSLRLADRLAGLVGETSNPAVTSTGPR